MSNPKPIEDRERRNMPAIIEHSPPPGLQPPPAPSWLSTRLLATWHGLWTSPVARLLDPVSDLPAVARLFRLYVLGEQLDDAVAAHMDAHLDALTSPDGDGQGDGHAFNDKLLAMRLRVASETRLIEAQLGLSPRSRLALGLALAAGKKAAGSLDDIADDAND